MGDPAGARGCRVGPYELLEELGRGGMGRVYRARHVARGVDVALKTMVAGKTKGSADVARRLLEEVRVVATLRHPGVVAILDVGRLDATSAETLAAFEGCPFLVMELAPGGSLTPLRQQLDFEALVSVADQLLLALGHAHAHGILHCDVKLANVLRAGPAGSLAELRLADFGVAAFYGGAEGPRYKGGTPACMPPEQRSGDVRVMGPWSDLYSLAKALSELLRPGTPVPEGFARWLSTCLAASWRRRYRCAADARAELRALSLDGPVAVWSAEAVGTASSTTTDDTTDGDVPSVSSVAVAPPRPEVVVPSAPWPPRDVALAAAPTRPVVDGVEPSLAALRTAPLLGRDREQSLLWDAVEEAVAAGGPRLVTVEGGAGLGKTRLMRWLLQRIAEVGAGRGWYVEGDGSGDVQALLDALRRDLRAGGLRGARLREHLATVAPEAARDLAGLLEPGGAAADGGVTAVVARYLASCACARPAVLGVEEGFEAPWVTSLVMELAGRWRSPIVVVLTGRAEPALATLEEVAPLRRVRLGPLRDEDLGRLVQSLGRLDAPTAAAIAARAGGNPRYATELLRFWLEEGHLRPAATSARVDALPLPEGVETLARRRLERLLRRAAPGAREALELAAAGGARVSRPRWIAACEGAGVARDLCPWVEERLEEAGELRRSASERRLGLGDWRFEDPVFREAILTAAGARRAHWHRLHASLASSAAERGGHLLAAGEATSAFEALVEGAAHCWDRGQHGRAHGLLHDASRALARNETPADHPSRGRHLLLRGRDELAFGSTERATELAEAAMRWASRYDRAHDRVEAMWLQGVIQARKGALQEAVFTLEGAHRRAQAHHLGSLWAEAFVAWVEAAELLPGMLPAIDEAMVEAMTRPVVRAEAEVEGVVLLARGRLRLRLGAVEDAHEDGLRALSQLPPRTPSAAKAAILLGRVEGERGRLEEALRWTRRGFAELQDLGADPAALWACRVELALLHNRGRDYAQTRSLLEGGGRWHERRRAGPMASFLRIVLLPAFAAFREWERFDRALEAAPASDGARPDAARELERAGDEAHAAGERGRALAAFALADRQLFRLGEGDQRARLLAKRRAIEAS